MRPTVGTLLLYWDYDTQWGADRSRSGPQPWGPDEFTNTDRLMVLLDEYDVRACFAVVGSAALPGRRPYHDPDQIRALHAAGHEIASHSHRHEWLPELGDTRLRETITSSKDALQQCLGAEVVSFVPPFNQPFDYARRGAFSRSERRSAGADRIDLARLCRALGNAGYRTCRICYRPMHRRVIDLVARRRTDQPVYPEQVEGIVGLRLNTAGGFGADAIAMLHRVAAAGGIAVVYGHPHSLYREGPQHETYLRTFLETTRSLRAQGRLVVRLPREVISPEAVVQGGGRCTSA